MNKARTESRPLRRALQAIVLAVMVAGALASCAVGPDYVRPTAAVPESFKEMKGWKVAEPRDEIVRGRWWEIYNDPDLNALEEQVVISNQNIAVAEAQFRQALAQVRMDRASFFPTVTAAPSVTRSLRSSNISSSVPAGSTTTVTTPSTAVTDLYTAALGLSSWEMDVWGRIRRVVEADRANALASAADLENARLSAQASLAQNYFTLRSSDRLKQLLDATVANYEKSLQLTMNQYEAGIVSKGDVLQAETQLKIARAQAIDVGVQRAQSEHAIAVLIGQPASNFSIPVSPLNAEPPRVPQGIPSELLERRPDIAGAERRVAAANAVIGVARAAYFPTITLSGVTGYQSNWSDNLISQPSNYWSIGAALTQTLFDGGFRFAQSDKVWAAYDQSVAAYRQTVLTAFQDVEDNLSTLRILEQEAVAQDDAVKTARKTVEFAINQYKAGTVNYLTVVVLQAAALSAEKTAVTIMNSRMAASVGLIRALGGGWNAADLSAAAETIGKRARPELEPVSATPAGQSASADGS